MNIKMEQKSVQHQKFKTKCENPNFQKTYQENTIEELDSSTFITLDWNLTQKKKAKKIFKNR